MWGSNLVWNLLCEPMDKTPSTSDNHQHDHPQGHQQDLAPVIEHSDRWIIGVWIVVALIAVAILPFASRMGDVARAIASFCGITIT